MPTRGEQLASIPLVEGRRALRGEKPNRSTLKQGCGGCRDRSDFKNRTEQGRPSSKSGTVPPTAPPAEFLGGALCLTMLIDVSRATRRPASRRWPLFISTC